MTTGFLWWRRRHYADIHRDDCAIWRFANGREFRFAYEDDQIPQSAMAKVKEAVNRYAEDIGMAEIWTAIEPKSNSQPLPTMKLISD